MNKILNVLIVSSTLFLGGCATTSTNSGNSTKVNNDSTQANQPISTNVNIYQQLQNLNLSSAVNLGDSYYESGDYANALVAYDYTCARFQDIPTCLKMAKMFEKGEGSPVNKTYALDIYKRSCFGGHTDSCKDMKRLER